VGIDARESLVPRNGNGPVCHIEPELAVRTVIDLPTTVVRFENIVHEVLNGGFYGIGRPKKVAIRINAGQFDLQIDRR
jgi:hypothetical protein